MSRAIALQDWPQLLALLGQALDLPATKRADWQRRQRLPTLLEQSLGALLDERSRLDESAFLSALPALPPAPPEADPPADLSDAGARIGPWRLLRPLGQGGMSVVWLAERADGLMACPVAVKLPHPGSGQALLARRLRRERHILGLLEHPNIARLIDIGTADSGTPYLVMEFVQGKNLLDHADQQRLSLTQRLALFDQVLRAVQFAHERRVLHRDLKPDNVLVTAAGEVKLLDFGIATLLNPGAGNDRSPALSLASETTGAAGHRLTPGYASPEQWQGLPLGVTSDVYALGVMLTELLCGHRRHGQFPIGAAQLEHAVLHEAARPPSRCVITAAAALARGSTPRALTAAMRGDLDAIVMTALARHPGNRYASAAGLREDLERWRTGRRAGVRSSIFPGRVAGLLHRLRAGWAPARLAVAARRLLAALLR